MPKISLYLSSQNTRKYLFKYNDHKYEIQPLKLKGKPIIYQEIKNESRTVKTENPNALVVPTELKLVEVGDKPASPLFRQHSLKIYLFFTF